MKLQRLIPPIIVDVLKGVRSGPLFASFDLAAQACGGKSYEEKTLLNVVRRKTEIYREHLQSAAPVTLSLGEMQLLAVIGLQAGRDQLRVIDFGGACGAHYFTLKALFGQRSLRVRWHVVETPGMAAEARSLENEELKFFHSLAEATKRLEGVDIVFASGALQYVPDPYDTLRGLVECGAKHLVLARLGMTAGQREVIVVHKSMLGMNGPGPLPEGFEDAVCAYPYTFPVKGKIDTIIKRRYRLAIEVPDQSGVFPVKKEPLIGVGYIAERVVPAV